ncbi:hypothetical protein ACFL1H_01715 [Nanoarchaeota archaeon]
MTKSNEIQSICNDCANKQREEDGCWYFFEGKKLCTQFRRSFMEEPQMKKQEEFDPKKLLKEHFKF